MIEGVVHGRGIAGRTRSRRYPGLNRGFFAPLGSARILASRVAHRCHSEPGRGIPAELSRKQLLCGEVIGILLSAALRSE